MAVKISILGAGSGIFSLNMIRDLCLTENLQDSAICFMDIDEKRLDASYTLCMRLAKQMGIRLNISKTTSREEALTGADFVVNTILIGGYRGWKEGWSIAKKWGYRMGGSMHIMHDEAFWINFYQLRMIEDVQLDIKRICPNAWYLLVSNPVMAATTYLPQVSGNENGRPVPWNRNDPDDGEDHGPRHRESFVRNSGNQPFCLDERILL